jgi:predicted transglutaminase-like cysteine proteinase
MLCAMLCASPAAAESVILPYEWLEMCSRQGGCERAAPLSMEDVAWVNAAINRAITSSDDPGEDPWRAFPENRTGDCDDYVATKRAALLALGVEAGSLTIVTGWATYPDGTRTPHIVLEVAFGDSSLTLDNLVVDAIYPPGAAPYPFIPEAREPRSGVLWITAKE